MWSASDSEQELELLELCKKRVVPVGVPAEELTWNDVLLPTQKSVEKCVCCIAGISQVKSRHCFQSVSYVIHECDCCISLIEQPSRPSSRYLFCARLADLATGQTSFASVLFCLVFLFTYSMDVFFAQVSQCSRNLSGPSSPCSREDLDLASALRTRRASQQGPPKSISRHTKPKSKDMPPQASLPRTIASVAHAPERGQRR